MAKKLVRSFSIVIILSILLAQFGLRPAAAAAEFHRQQHGRHAGCQAR